MIDEKLKKIEERVRNSPSLRPENRQELLNLIAELKGEIGPLSETDRDHAETIAGFADLSTHESTRASPNAQTHRLAVDGLSSTVQGFEEKHPKLVAVVNQICSTLSSLGI